MQSLPTKEETHDDGESVRVFLRVRPGTERELAIASPQVVFVDGPSVMVKSDPPRSFTFDGVLGEQSTQQEVFESVGRAVGSSCLAGYNGSVYVYGQTGAGKTHTMCGPINSVQSMQFDERRGIICRMLDFIFAEVARRAADGNSSEHRCRCSFLEIYKEQITDLLEPQNANLQVREDLTRGVYVERLSEVAVSSLAEAFQVLWRGLRQRQVGSTHMNEKSSRSHAVFTLYVEAHEKRAGVTSTRVASLKLVDLAGSERQQHAGDPRSSLGQYADTKESLRVKEAGAINKSLSALTNVIMALSREERLRRERRGERRNNYVHYRDSKLTFLLRDSLGGNSKTVIVANCSPAEICVQETISTLKFAARAKHIRCSVVRNEAFSGTVESLMEEVKFMRKKLASLSGHSFDKSTLLADGPGTIEEPEAEDSAEDLDSQQQVARLEVLLSAALEREQQADQRQHRLQRLAKFLEDLDFRKCSGWRKLYKDYASQLQQVQASAITDDDEVQELSSKLVGFAALLGNLVQGARLEDGEEMTESTQSTETPPQVEDLGEEISGDEVAFIREENRLLRRQLEDHPEVQRLRAENWQLREELRALDPAGWPRFPSIEGSGEKVPSPPGVSAEALLRGFEDDDTSSKTWFYFQKVAKEVEELTRAKEKLIYAMEVAEQTGPTRTQDTASASRRREEGDEQERSSVSLSLVHELDIATREALKQAQDLLRPGGLRLVPGRRGAKEVDEGSSGLAVEEAAPVDEEDRLKQAFLRIKQLQGTVDLVNAAYGDAFDEFQGLREEYESRWEECQFFELQCSRLNLTCLDLADRLVPGRPRPGFSTTGFWPSATEKQKRSFSMTSLRDVSFWEQRFQELQELTGAVVEDQIPATAMPSMPSMPSMPRHGDLAQSNSMSALAAQRSQTPPLSGPSTADVAMRRVLSAPVLVAPHVVAVPPAVTPLTPLAAPVSTPWMPIRAGPPVATLAMPTMPKQVCTTAPPVVPKLALGSVGSMSTGDPSVAQWMEEGRHASSVGRAVPTVPMSRLSDAAPGPMSQRASLPARVPLQVPLVPAVGPGHGHRWQAPKQVPHTIPRRM